MLIHTVPSLLWNGLEGWACLSSSSWYDLGQSMGGPASSHEQAKGVEQSSHGSDCDSHYETQPWFLYLLHTLLYYTRLRGILKHWESEVMFYIRIY